MIMLPLHGQGTAAVKRVSLAGGASNTSNARGDVFGKQAGLVLPSSFYFL